MPKINLRYEGSLRVSAKHQDTGASLTVDSLIDDFGSEENFGPTDLFAISLGSCIAILMGIVANRHKIDLKGMEIEVEKIMHTEGTRRIGTLNVRVELPHKLEERQLNLIKRAALGCPVVKSIHPDTKVTTEFTMRS